MSAERSENEVPHHVRQFNTRNGAISLPRLLSACTAPPTPEELHVLYPTWTLNALRSKLSKEKRRRRTPGEEVRPLNDYELGLLSEAPGALNLVSGIPQTDVAEVIPKPTSYVPLSRELLQLSEEAAQMVAEKRNTEEEPDHHRNAGIIVGQLLHRATWLQRHGLDVQSASPTIKNALFALSPHYRDVSDTAGLPNPQTIELLEKKLREFIDMREAVLFSGPALPHSAAENIELWIRCIFQP